MSVVAMGHRCVAAIEEWAQWSASMGLKENEAKTQLQTTTRTVKVYAEEAKAETAQGDP